MGNRKQPKKRRQQPAKKPQPYSAARELLKLRREIDADLAAGQISQSDYDFCKERIEAELASLAKPLPPGQKIRVTGIPRKQVDWDKLARALVLGAEAQLRRDRGEPPLSEAEYRQRETELLLATQEAKRQEAKDEERKRQADRHRFIKRKPPALRQETWDWLIAEELESLPEDGRLGPVTYQFGIIDQPQLLRETIIQLGDGQDYVIDQDAAQALADGRRDVPLVRLTGQSKQAVPREEVIEALAQGSVFEQLSADAASGASD